MFWINAWSFIKSVGIVIWTGIKKFFKWDSEQGKWLSPLKTFIILGLVIYIIFFTSTCNKGRNNPCSEVKSDTVHITHIDTLFFEKTPTITKGKKPIKHGNGVSVVDTPKTKCDSLFQYTQEYEDSLIKGTLFADVRGELISSKFKYTPKFPKYIFKTDSIIITNTKETFIYKRPYGLIVGGGLNIDQNPKMGFNLDLGVQFKNGVDLIYRYDPLRTQHSIDITYTFQFPPKNKK
jgi:hypothetical protein